MADTDRTLCLDFLHFQDTLKKMRLLDDKIIYTMNTLPTESFKHEKDCNATCKQIYEQLELNYKKREEALNKCIKYTSKRVQELKLMREENSSDMDITKQLKKEQGKLKLFRTELGVEEVVREKTKKVYYEGCRQFYIPPDLTI